MFAARGSQDGCDRVRMRDDGVLGNAVNVVELSNTCGGESFIVRMTDPNQHGMFSLGTRRDQGAPLDGGPVESHRAGSEGPARRQPAKRRSNVLDTPQARLGPG